MDKISVKYEAFTSAFWVYWGDEALIDKVYCNGIEPQFGPVAAALIETYLKKAWERGAWDLWTPKALVSRGIEPIVKAMGGVVC